MENLVRTAIRHYNDFMAEAQLYETWVVQDNKPDLKQKLIVLKMQIATINAWLQLLNHDERFVVQKHLIDEIEWPRVAFEYRERWKNEFFRTERSLQIYQANAIAKISAFADKHREITLHLFSIFLNDQENDEKSFPEMH